MVRQELVDYLTQLKNQGVDPDEGISQLYAAGWTEEQINEAKQVVYGTENQQQDLPPINNVSNLPTSSSVEQQQSVATQPSDVLSKTFPASSSGSTKSFEITQKHHGLLYVTITLGFLVVILVVAGLYFFILDNSSDKRYSSTTDGGGVQALCYLATADVSDEPDSPNRHGIRAEVICAHATLPVIGYDSEASQIALIDGDTDLLGAGKEWVENYRQENPGSMFFSTEIQNALEASTVDRVLSIKTHTNALPASGVALMKGTVVLKIESDERATFDTTIADIKNQSDITLNENSGLEVSSRSIGFINNKQIYTIDGNVAFDEVLDPPSGVENGEIRNQAGIIIDENVPADTQLRIQVRKGDPLSLSVNVPIKIPE